MNIPNILQGKGDPFCQEMHQIKLTENEIRRECGDPKGNSYDMVCCKLGKEEKLGKRKCDSDDTSKKCSRQGGIFKGDCDTIENENVKTTPSCTCCVEKQKKCSPKDEYEDKHGFCVEKRKYCVKAGGIHIRNGCDCKKSTGKTHLCYKEKFHWCYEGDCGAEFWADHYPICGLDRQSPIDIISADAVAVRGVVTPKADPFVFTLWDDTPNSMTLVNNGHSVTCYWNDAAKPSVEGGGLGTDYILAQFHFHWGSDSTKGSEHLIDGKAFPIELHMVHYKASYGSLGEAVKYGDGLAVLGVMMEVGDENDALAPIIKGLSDVVVAKTETEIQYDMPLKPFLPANTDSFYRYLGSLTTPGCNEVVVWTVFKEPLYLSETQLEEFRTLLDSKSKPIVDNFRPVQPLNDRTITVYGP